MVNDVTLVFPATCLTEAPFVSEMNLPDDIANSILELAGVYAQEAFAAKLAKILTSMIMRLGGIITEEQYDQIAHNDYEFPEHLSGVHNN